MSHQCIRCSSPVDSTDKFCRECGFNLKEASKMSSNTTYFGDNLKDSTKFTTSTTSSTTAKINQACRGNNIFSLFIILLTLFVFSVQLTNSEETTESTTTDYGRNGGLWHKVGELFNREQQRQRKIKHDTADAVENGPKEISIFCPQDPQIRIVDLSEDDRDRDECLVLNIAAPDVSSRLVLFCNAQPLESEDEAETGESNKENNIPNDEL
jgi:hypothetical protein